MGGTARPIGDRYDKPFSSITEKTDPAGILTRDISADMRCTHMALGDYRP